MYGLVCLFASHFDKVRSMYVVNIIVRSLVIVVGLLLLLSIPPFIGLSSPLQEVFGTVVMLFGVLRLVLYLSRRRHQSLERDV